MSELKTNKISTNDQNNVAIDNALGLKGYDTTGRNSLTSVAGDMIYNTTDSKVQVFDGSAWNDLGGEPVFTINYLAVGGGGSGSGTGPYNHFAGGGGAGGFLTNLPTATAGGGGDLNPYVAIKKDGTTGYKVSVGAGGVAGTGIKTGADGSNSEFAGFLAIGGGGGGSYKQSGGVGGSGGGGGNGAGSAGTPNQGFAGGDGSFTASNQGYGGGGGGAASAGSNGSSGTGGTGGTKLAITITNASKDYCGGGGGAGGTGQGSGGGAGASNGAAGAANAPGNATANTGSGGGGAGSLGGQTAYTGGNGGSGEVVLRWATADATIGATRTGLVDGGVLTDGTDSYIAFTGREGTITFS